MESQDLQSNSFSSFLKSIYNYFLISIKFIKNNINLVSITIPVFILLKFPGYHLKDTIQPEQLLEKAPILIFSTIFSLCMSVIFDILVINYLRRKEGSSFQNLKSDIEKQFFPVIKVKILTFLYVFGGFLLFIVPGIILALRYTLIIYFAICYNQPFSVAKENSSKLMLGYKWYFFLLIAIFVCVYICITLVVDFSLFSHLSSKTETLQLSSILLEFSISYLVSIIVTIVLYLFWKDRLNKEH